jgi:zinc transporter ZupT
MKKAIRYAVLNMSVPVMALGVLLCAGALAEGLLPAGLAVSAGGLLCVGIRAAWREICRMERLARQVRRHRRAVAAVAAPARPVPDLRVA